MEALIKVFVNDFPDFNTVLILVIFLFIFLAFFNKYREMKNEDRIYDKEQELKDTMETVPCRVCDGTGAYDIDDDYDYIYCTNCHSRGFLVIGKKI